MASGYHTQLVLTNATSSSFPSSQGFLWVAMSKLDIFKINPPNLSPRWPGFGRGAHPGPHGVGVGQEARPRPLQGKECPGWSCVSTQAFLTVCVLCGTNGGRLTNWLIATCPEQAVPGFSTPGTSTSHSGPGSFISQSSGPGTLPPGMFARAS